MTTAKVAKTCTFLLAALKFNPLPQVREKILCKKQRLLYFLADCGRLTEQQQLFCFSAIVINIVVSLSSSSSSRQQRKWMGEFLTSNPPPVHTFLWTPYRPLLPPPPMRTLTSFKEHLKCEKLHASSKFRFTMLMLYIGTYLPTNLGRSM